MFDPWKEKNSNRLKLFLHSDQPAFTGLNNLLVFEWDYVNKLKDENMIPKFCHFNYEMS